MTTDVAPALELAVTCDRDALSAGLGVVSRAASTRSSVQVLSGVLVQGREGVVTLAATDLEVSLRARVAAAVEGEGEVVVPGKLLADLVRLLPEPMVVLTHDAGSGIVTVRSGSHTSRLSVFAAEDFPRLPETEVAAQTISTRALLETVEKVSRAASRDESRPVLTGILVRFEDSRLVMAATDSYRLAVKETPLAEAGPALDAIIPARALQEVVRLAGAAEEVRLGVHENHVVFGVGDVWLTSRRIDGQFPNYRQLLPESFEAEAIIPRSAMLEVVRRAAVLAQRSTPLRLRFSEGELAVSAQTQDVGEAHETLAIEYSGEPLEIGFNPDFLREGLEAVGTENVQLKLINPLRPGLIASPDEGFWYLIMPIRLAG